MPDTSAPTARAGFDSRRYVPPPGVGPGWYGETLAWRPALDVTLELADGGEYSGMLMTPEPESDPATGALAMWFHVPGKLHPDPVPLADVVAFTVHTPAPAGGRTRLARLRTLLSLLLWDLPRLALATLTDRSEPDRPPAPEPVTDHNPLHELITAAVVLARDDRETVDRVTRAIDAALRGLPGLSDVHVTVPPETSGHIRIDVLLRAPNGPDREATTRDAMDTVMYALDAIEAMPGVDLIEFGYGDL